MGAVGNLPTEDIVHLLNELNIVDRPVDRRGGGRGLGRGQAARHHAKKLCDGGRHQSQGHGGREDPRAVASRLASVAIAAVCLRPSASQAAPRSVRR